jgi:CheY-like chemotaxis protein
MKTILVVDDEFGLAEAVCAVLSDEGYRVLNAVNGRQGLDKLAEAKPDLIMVDYMMPVMDGPTMLTALRQLPDYAHVPVILMSGVTEAMARTASTQYNAFLRKPFDAKTLIATVQRVLGEPQT